MNAHSLFQVNLQGLTLTEDQTLELEKRLTETTMDFLGSFKAGKEFSSNAVAYKPNPDDPYPWPWPWPGPWGPVLGPITRFPLPRPFPGFFPIDRRLIDRNFEKLRG